MSIFSRWKRRTLEDATFGHLAYQSVGCWEGAMTLGEGAVDIVVDAGEDGPLEHQRKTAALVAEQFAALVAEARQFARLEARAKVDSLSFERDEGAWELVLVTDTDSHYYCVRMRGQLPVELRVDG